MTVDLRMNEDAEASVLGILLVSPKSVPVALSQLAPDDLAVPSNRLVYEAIRAIDDTGSKPDSITVADYLDSHGQLDLVGGRSYVHSLASAAPASAVLEQHIQIIRRHALSRRLDQLSVDIQQLQRKETPEKILAHISEALDRIEGHQAKDMIHLAEAIAAHTVNLADRLQKGQTTQGHSSGYIHLDNLLSGLRPGALILIAARPGLGKTALALNMAVRVAEQTGPVALFSIEQPTEELVVRMLGATAKVRITDYLAGKLRGPDAEAIAFAQSHLSRLPLFVADQTDVTPADIRAAARRIKRRHGLSLLVVDYVQLLAADRTYDTREREIADASRRLKLIAKELDIPVLALAQLNRQVEGRADKRPQLSDLRESGALEQDADQVLFIYRDDAYDANSADKGIAELIVRKNRHGALGTVKLAFTPDYCRFAEMPQGPPVKEQI